MSHPRKPFSAELPWQQKSVLSAEKTARQAISRSLTRFGDWLTFKA